MTRNLYTHLEGDLDARPQMLIRLEALARNLGTKIYITSGGRRLKEQAQLYAERGSNPYPVAAPSVNAPHIERVAADATINGQPIQNVVSASKLGEYGLEPLAGDAVHVQLAGTIGKDAAEIREMARSGFAVAGAGGKSLVEKLTGVFGFDPSSAVPIVGPAADLGSKLLGAIGVSPGDVAGEIGGAIDGPVSDVASAVISQLFDLLGVNANAIVLNIGLIGGGTLLTYYGIALMAGVKSPVMGPLRKGTETAGAVAVAVPK